ncbi:hypothetical protein [Bacillus chungangensis]|uniref:Membrane protein n=1 Tax=Bacillus chungangensis TaxID=587633 RepID=A0ABT9WYW2_9BACI|nr:hypothetical protein [Bacillus chungangensis]MDQ0178293.1 putative membrane protein [Bacillus chungangensis]
MNKFTSNKALFLTSVIITFIISFIPKIGIMTLDTDRLFGFPAKWFELRVAGNITFNVWSLLFNFLFYYLILLGIRKILSFLFKIIKKQ